MSVLYTFKNLQDQVLSTLDEAGDTSTTLTLVRNYLNQAHQARLASANWPFLRWGATETLTTLNGVQRYALHSEFWRPIYFFNTGTAEYCHLIPERMLGTLVRPDTAARAGNFKMSGYSPVATQPAAAAIVTLTSSDTGDTGATKGVVITGVAGGVVRSETLTPSGLTPVASSLSFTKILRVTLTAVFTGSLSLTAEGVTILTLGPGDYGRVYPQIEFLSVLTQGDTIEYQFYRQPLPLTLDNDLPDIPPPHSQILVWDTLLLFAGYNTDLKGESILVWKDMQEKLEKALLEDYIEGQETNAMPRLVRDIEDVYSMGNIW